MSVWRGSTAVGRDASTHLDPLSAAVMTAINQLMTRPPARVCACGCVYLFIYVHEHSAFYIILHLSRCG